MFYKKQADYFFKDEHVCIHSMRSFEKKIGMFQIQEYEPVSGKHRSCQKSEDRSSPEGISTLRKGF